MSEPRESEVMTGYVITGVYTSKQEFRLDGDADGKPDKGVQFGWDWRMVKGPVFEVQLRIALEPTRARPYAATIVTIGQFRKVFEMPTLPIELFVTLQAPAILLPYARQFMSSLTAGSPTGAWHLPLINTSQLMKRFDPTLAMGYKQIHGDGAAKPQKRPRKPRRTPPASRKQVDQRA